MILLTLDGAAETYWPTHPLLAAGLRYLREADLMALPVGKHPIPFFDTKDLFVIADAYDTRSAQTQVWESHRVYGDIQVVLTGEERHGWLPRSNAPPVKTPHDTARDVAFYEVSPTLEAGAEFIRLEPGRAVVFFPEDIHSPGLMIGSPKPIRKIVVKFRV